MRVLLLHPEDSPLHGPWTEQRWDLIVDLGKSSAFSEERWSRKLGCPVLRADSLRNGIEDARAVGKIFSECYGQLIDEQGIDWWDITSLIFEPEALVALVVARVGAEIDPRAELWATRLSWPTTAVQAVTGRSVRGFDGALLTRSLARASHYAGLFRRFSAARLKEIFLDKYDGGYQWRARFARKLPSAAEPVVLLPSAYVNVSRMAASYARMLPQQSFLMVAARWSAKQVTLPPNVTMRDLASYAEMKIPQPEVDALVQRWSSLAARLSSSPELGALLRAGVFDSFPRWFRYGLCARNAWLTVLDREPVCAVLCGDDSNMYTRLPVVLAARRKIPTIDFHHGAFDGRFLLKELPSDLYLAKNGMEVDYLVRVCGLPCDRIVIGAPAAAQTPAEAERREPTSAVFFSEPYESSGMRGEEVYREIMPALCGVARQAGRNVIVKLHPFESRVQRMRMLEEILRPEDHQLVTVVEGPLTRALLAQAWLGVTVESTAALDCVQAGVRCFVCGWLACSQYEYVAQYARFGVGEILQNAQQLREIPTRMEDAPPFPAFISRPAEPLDASTFQRWLTRSETQTTGRTA
jgi:hypothetical protein